MAVRFPFLDPGVAGFCLALPPALRARGDTGKWLLREAVRGLVPEELRLRPKQPRLAPAGGAGWRACYEAALAPDRLRALEVIDPAAVRGLLGRAEDPAVDAVLMKLASLTHLQERIAWRASSS